MKWSNSAAFSFVFVAAEASMSLQGLADWTGMDSGLIVFLYMYGLGWVVAARCMTRFIYEATKPYEPLVFQPPTIDSRSFMDERRYT